MRFCGVKKMIDENKLIIEIEKRNSVFTEDQLDLLEYLIIKQAVIGNDTNVGSKWIPCSERLPKPYELVLIQNIHGVMSVASRTGKKWFNFQGIELWEAVAWQPLPKPYRGDDHE